MGVISNYTSNTLVSGTSGHDSIYNYGDNVTINTGTGNDTIYNDFSDNVIISAGDGNDSVYNRDGDSVAIDMGAGNDSVYNSLGDSLTIDMGAGDDSVYNYNGDSMTINAGAGNDSVYNYSGDSVTIDMGAGNDSVYNYYGHYTSINGGAGNDTIFNHWGDNLTINAGAGSDSISLNGGTNITVIGGTGNDTIKSNGSNVLFKYSSGDGNDRIEGMKMTDTLEIDGGTGTYSSQVSGSDIIVNVGTSKITLIGAASISAYIDGVEVKSKLITLTEGDDNYSNTVEGMTINALGGNDTVYNQFSAAAVKVIGGGGNDSLHNDSSNVTMDGGSGNDTLQSDRSSTSNVSMNGGTGNDYIWNYSTATTILGGAGNDTLKNFDGSSVSIFGGSGNDDLSNRGGNNLTLVGGDGMDSLWNEPNNDSGKDALNISIVGGVGDDFIKNFGNKATLLGGDGNDTIYNYRAGYKNGVLVFDSVGQSVKILGDDGDDYLYNQGDSVTIDAGVGSDSVYNYGGKEVSINGDNDNDLISNQYADKATLLGGSGDDTIWNWNTDDTKSTGVSVSIDGGAGNDTIWNDGNSAIISGGTGNDSISNYNTSVTMIGDDGNDYIYNYQGDYAFISAGNGNDSIYNKSWYSTVSTGSGNDTIINYASGKATSIDGGAGSDKISLSANEGSMTVKGGSGNDTIYGDSSGTYGILYQYSSGDGNDKIIGFTSYDTLQIGGGKGSYSSLTSGKNIIVTVGNGKISLIGAASLGSGNVHIDGKEEVKNTWTLDGSTAKYGTASNTLIKVTNVKSLDGLSIDTKNKIVTVAKASVNKKKITLTGDSYTLALADDVEKRTTEPAAWSYSNGTANYKSSYKTKGYLLASNAKSISYYSTATAPETLATVKGVKSKDGLSVDTKNKIVTVAEASVNKKKITLTGDGYTLKLAKGLTPTTKPAAWSYSNGTATYKSSYQTEGYTLASNAKSINYSKATTASTLASIKGAKSKTGLSVSGKKITLKKSALKDKVTISGGYEFSFASDYKNATITGSSKADSITTNGSKLSINGGAGDDTIKMYGSATSVTGGNGADLFLYNKGTHVIRDYKEEDKISIASGTAEVTTSGNNVIFTVDSGKITVTGGKGKTITYSDDSGKNKKYKYMEEPADDEIVILPKNYTKESYTMGTGVLTLDASAVRLDIEITGNKLMNSIRAGNGNDTLIGGGSNDSLTGGKGADVFVWNKGDGNDIITDYTDEDTILIKGDSVKTVKASDDDLIFTLAGKNKITLTGGADKLITYTDAKGDHTYSHLFTFKGKSVTLKPDYPNDKSFDLSNYSTTFATVDASKVTHGMNIVGNASANSIKGTNYDDIISGFDSGDTIRGNEGNDSILGGAGNDSLFGGPGNDTLWGGKGTDYLDGGDGHDIFVFDRDSGNDKIFGYEQGIDRIMILTNEQPILEGTPLTNDVTFNINGGKITVVEGAHKTIQFVDSKGKNLEPYVPK